MRFRLNNQDYIRLQTIAFFIPMIEKAFDENTEEDIGLTITYFNSPITIYKREICAFKKLQQIFNNLTNLLLKNDIYDMQVKLDKQKTPALELGKQIKAYLSLESTEEINELLQFINKKFYTISDAAQFVTRFSDIVDCYKFSQLSQDVDFLKIVAEPILFFASLSPRNFPLEFQYGIIETVSLLKKHGTDHSKWSKDALNDIIRAFLDVYHKAHEMGDGKCNNDEAAIKKEIERRKNISEKKIEKNKERRKELDEKIQEIKKGRKKTISEACQEYFYSHTSELKNLGITSWRTLANRCSQKDPNKSRKENNPAQKIQPLSVNKCQSILAPMD